MRLSRKVWIILGLIVFVVLAIILGTTYSSQVGERRDLTNQLTVAQNRLPVLTGEKETLEGQLGTARSSVDEAAAKYPQELHSIEYGEHIYDIVAKSNVALSGLSFPVPSASSVGTVSYSTVGLSLAVSGTRADIFEFIRTIRTDSRFASTRVNSISMSGTSASISVTIYAYRR
jgi:hypothetical protein